MKILVIDDSVFFRKMISLYLSSEMEDAIIEAYDLETLGKPGVDYDWGQYDLLLLDYDLGDHDTGLDWLKEYRDRPGFPPTIMLAGEGNEYIATRAIKVGAAEYLNKKDLEERSICDLVRKTLEESTPTEDKKSNFSDEATQIFDRSRKNDDLASRKLSIGYKLYSKIGETPLSKVYLAEKTGNTDILVIKILDLRKIKNKKLVERFRREAQFISEIKNPFVVKVYESGITDEFGFIAMEFFSRGDLKERIKTRPTPDLALIYMQHIMHGLAAIHAKGIIHRDLKPANIMFRSDDSLALADFGISKQMNDDMSD
ncbi:MAG: DNA-binding response OmpR family regulator, partial [Gammaproteobacteria bacterium]